MTKLKMCQKDPCYSDIKVYNNLPHAIRKLSENIKLFKEVLRDYLLKPFARWKNTLIIKPTNFNHRNII